MIDLLSQPWPWYVAGPIIGLAVPFVFWFGGRRWGVSSSLQHLCAATIPAGIEYLSYDWKRQGGWSLAMVTGALIGGAIASLALPAPNQEIAISSATRADLAAMGLSDLSGMMPAEVFNWASLLTPAGLVMIVLGGFLVGFGARWAGGCTSGHAISGLSTLRRSSLAAVIGFFVGGLVSAHILIPVILGGQG